MPRDVGPRTLDLVSPRRPRRRGGASMLLVRLSTGCVAALVFAQCVSYKAVPLVREQHFAQLQTRRLDSTPVRGALAAAQLGSLESDTRWTLDRLTVAAWTLRPEIVQARAELDASIAEDEAVTTRQNPTLTVSPERFLSGAQPWTIATQLDLLIGASGKRKIQREAATERQLAARVRLAETAWQIGHDVRAAWLVWCVAGERALALERAAAVRASIRDLTAARVTAGRMSQRENANATAQAFKSQAELQTARTAVSAARAALAVAVGVTDAELDAVFAEPPRLDALPNADRFSLDELTHQAVFDRLDLWRTLHEYASQEQLVRLEVAKQHPNLTLGPGYGWDRGEHKLLLGFSIELPLFNRNQAAIAQAEAQRAAIAARFDTLQSQARGGVDSAYAVLQAASTELEALTRARLSFASMLQREQAVVASGAGDRLTVSEFQSQVIDAERAEIEGRNAVASALLDLENAVQRPLWPLSALARIPAALSVVEQTNTEAP